MHDSLPDRSSGSILSSCNLTSSRFFSSKRSRKLAVIGESLPATRAGKTKLIAEVAHYEYRDYSST